MRGVTRLVSAALLLGLIVGGRAANADEPLPPGVHVVNEGWSARATATPPFVSDVEDGPDDDVVEAVADGASGRVETDRRVALSPDNTTLTVFLQLDGRSQVPDDDDLSDAGADAIGIPGVGFRLGSPGRFEISATLYGSPAYVNGTVRNRADARLVGIAATLVQKTANDPLGDLGVENGFSESGSLPPGEYGVGLECGTVAPPSRSATARALR